MAGNHGHVHFTQNMPVISVKHIWDWYMDEWAQKMHLENLTLGWPWGDLGMTLRWNSAPRLNPTSGNCSLQHSKHRKPNIMLIGQKMNRWWSFKVVALDLAELNVFPIGKLVIKSKCCIQWRLQWIFKVPAQESMLEALGLWFILWKSNL